MAGRLFGTNGVRGVVNEEMTVEFAMDLGRAIGTYMGRKVAIGNDSRTSADMLKSSVSAGLMSVGSDVLDLGLIPTPALQFQVQEQGINGGVMITASHNPPEFNGIKCMDDDGTEMPRSKEEAIEDIYFSRSFNSKAWNELGSIRKVSGAVATYLSSVERHVDAEAISAAGLTVALDCASGAGSVSTPYLLESLGVRAITINCNPQGTFPGRPSEPIENNLGDLMSLVKNSSADMGIAHDGDADRTIFVDDQGRYMYGDRSLALVAESIVRELGGGIVVTPVSTSLAVEEAVAAAGGEVVYTMVGAPIVARKMREIGAVFGGEENGGLIFPEHQYCRDGAMAAAKMLEIVARQGTISELLARLPQYHLDKRKVQCPDEHKGRVLELLCERFKGENVDLTDGVKVYMDEGWILIRPSGTEPIFRIISEGKTKSCAQTYADDCEKQLKELIEDLLND
ncbi:MAG: phosphoglucosamine mutase [Methanomassiliicoccales archaeon]|jgi:phosphomannomutase/phosphoglucomutase